MFSGSIVEGKRQWCLVWKKWETTDWLRFEEERLILELMKNWFWAAVIIFSSVWFLSIKIIKLKFYKIKNKTETETGSNRSVLILFGYFILKNQNPTDRFWLRLVWFGLVWFWCGLVLLFYIKNQNYIFLGGFFFLFSNRLGFDLV